MPMQFMRLKYLYFAISAIFLVPSLISLATVGLQPAIDFTGGALLEMQISPHKGKEVTETGLRQAVGSEFDIHSIQKTAEGPVILRMRSLSDESKRQLVERLSNEVGEVEELRFEVVGPTIGRELIIKTAVAISIAALLILLYVAYRFRELKYGVCAILAMFHDSIILLGAASLLGRFFGVEVDTLFVTAILTTLSFSVHDTIVVYDRIRENLRRHPKIPFEAIVDLSATQTLSRSLNNSLTIIFMLTALALLGGITIRWFALALLIGTITGTYSSTFTAAPLLVVWENFKRRNR